MAVSDPVLDSIMSAESRQKLREHFVDMPAEKHTGGWDHLWKQNFTPWDRNGPSFALKDAVVGHAEIFGSPLKDGSKQRKRAFIPGCGRGYDPMLLASLGYDAYGLDASQTAVESANKLKAASWNDEIYAANDPQVGRGEVKFLLYDFFKDEFFAETNGGNFDLIFDYTFLCALPPELRPPWAKRMSELLAPDGRLICLEWPLGKDPKEGGPPHGLTSDLYEQLFLHPGQEVQYNEAGTVIEDKSGEKSDNALVRVAHFMPERTHEAGKDKDHISIWKHWKA